MKIVFKSGNSVVLLFGGTSEERLVSVASAQNLAQQYEFSELIFQARDEKVYRVEKKDLFAHQDVFTKEFVPSTKSLATNIASALSLFANKVVFLALHGTQGENGELQTLLEDNKIMYTGSGSQASRLAFEKDLAKDVIANTDLPMAEEIRFTAGEAAKRLKEFENFLEQHKKIVFKPTASGSSFGLHIVENTEELAGACAAIAQSSFSSYLVENFLCGRELTVGVMQIGEELIALPASEIILNAGRAFDYEGKYLGRGSTEITPAVLDEAQLQAAQKLALDAHLAFDCYGYSRTDLILTAAGPYFLETNTLPGLSKPSFFPQQLQAADISFRTFIESQIELATYRYEGV